MPDYRFKALSELWWALIVAVATTVMQVLVTFEPEKIVDYRAWLVALGAAAVRAAAGAVLAFIGKRAITAD